MVSLLGKKMQNIQDSPLSRLASEVATKESSDGEVLKKARVAAGQEQDCAARIVQRVVRDGSNGSSSDSRDVSNSVSSSSVSGSAIVDDENTRQFFHAALVAEKYLLLDQVEGSSLYRCLNVHTQQELVCKVRIFFSRCFEKIRFAIRRSRKALTTNLEKNYV